MWFKMSSITWKLLLPISMIFSAASLLTPTPEKREWGGKRHKKKKKKKNWMFTTTRTPEQWAKWVFILTCIFFFFVMVFPLGAMTILWRAREGRAPLFLGTTSTCKQPFRYLSYSMHLICLSLLFIYTYPVCYSMNLYTSRNYLSIQCYSHCWSFISPRKWPTLCQLS